MTDTLYLLLNRNLYNESKSYVVNTHLGKVHKRQKDEEIISNFLCHEHILIIVDDGGHWGCCGSLGCIINSLCIIL